MSEPKNVFASELARLVAVTRVEILPENVAKIRGWVASRGGVAVWYSQDLSCAGRSVLTPALDFAGEQTVRPHWQYPAWPDKVVTAEADIDVLVLRTVVKGRRKTKAELYEHVPLNEYNLEEKEHGP